MTAIGVVYGDIGTSPLYAMRECFFGSHSVPPTHDNVLGVLSLIIYSLILVISIKYIAIVMRADNQGEGGILALTALLPQSNGSRANWTVLVLLGIFGAALLYGDGMITPAITVLGAIEGLKVATPLFEPYVVPVAVVILIAVFAIQRHGTHRVGRFFGPIMVVWFIAIAVLGIAEMIRQPVVLTAVDPRHAVAFFREHGWHGFAVLGAVGDAALGNRDDPLDERTQLFRTRHRRRQVLIAQQRGGLVPQHRDAMVGDAAQFAMCYSVSHLFIGVGRWRLEAGGWENPEGPVSGPSLQPLLL